MSSSAYTPHEQFADQADHYLDQNNIYDLFSTMLKRLAIHRPKDPYSFMISLLEQPTDTLKIIILGPPGAGKATQVAKIAVHYGVVPVRVDSLIREELANKTALGTKIKGFQSKDEPIPDDIIATMVGARVNKPDCITHGWVLDGYPTTRSQALALQMSQAGILCNKFILLQCPENICKERAQAADKFSTLELTPTEINQVYADFNRNIKQLVGLYSDVSAFVDSSKDIETVWKSTRTFLDRVPASKAPRRPSRVLVLGPTGAGKATQCTQLAQKYGMVHLSAGQLLRRESKKSQELRDQIAPYMNTGVLVPDEIVISIVCQRLLENDCRSRGWLLDGFPRNVKQAEALEKHKLVPSRCVMLDVPDEVATDRVIHRRVDEATGDIYRVKDGPPSSSIIADRLITQPKDKEESCKALLQEFRATQSDLEARYSGILKKVDGCQPIAEVLVSVEEFLLASLGSRRGKPAEGN